ncbi:chymotrypsin-2-like [Drosophila serrata]|uniref:chymotrypsin-2-like n=1 Tax=Drosophila serrata TaxID=7274 RepID=UPI000A1D1190|nr:chymotrypsin-2-like [Drosophila serrata]
MEHINILSLLLLLLVTCAANRFQNESELSLNRTRRLSFGMFNEDTLRLAKFMVSIRTRSVRYFYGENHFCGGVIIAPRYVLTSAHCLIIRSTRVIYPAYVLLIVAATPNRLRYQSGISFHSGVERIYVPDNFTLRNEQDIGVLLLTTKFPRDNKNIAIAKLPYRPVQMGAMCNVMGWGRMYKNGPISATILHAHIRIQNPKVCTDLLGITKKDLLCGTDEDKDVQQHPCGGDRGSPLMYNDLIFGIVSYLVDCGGYDLPSVYTDVYQSIGWIRRILMNNSNVCHVSLVLLYGAIVLNFLLIN